MRYQDYLDMEESNAMGEAIAAVWQAILADWGENDAKGLNRRIYKGTACGAHLSVWLHDGTWRHSGDLDGIDNCMVRGYLLGSIVEGSDAEVNGRPEDLLAYAEDEDGVLDAVMAFNDALQEVNDEACRLWDEANAEDEDTDEEVTTP
jgi:hypothetical protein